MTENSQDSSSFATSTIRSIDGAISRLVQGAMSGAGNLADEVDRFHSVRQKTLSILASITPLQALWSPRQGTWSIAQIADHLLRSEELYREQYSRLLQMAREGKGESIYISLREMDTSLAVVPREVMQLFEFPLRIFNAFVPPVFRETMVRYRFVPALNPRSSEPRAGLNLELLRQDLTLSLAKTEQLFRQPMPANVGRLTISHPIMGNNNLVQMFRIMTAHEERHQGQIAGLRVNPGFPQAAAMA